MSIGIDLDDVKRFFLSHGREDVWIHSRRVLDKTQALSSRWPSDLAMSAYTAALLHDTGVVIPVPSRVETARSFQLEILPEEDEHPAILHQKLSAAIASKTFGISNPPILAAIGCHTTLRRGATQLDKVVYIADKLSWDYDDSGQFFQAVESALINSLDDGVKTYLTWQWKTRASLSVIHPWLAAAVSEYEIG